MRTQIKCWAESVSFDLGMREAEGGNHMMDVILEFIMLIDLLLLDYECLCFSVFSREPGIWL